MPGKYGRGWKQTLTVGGVTLLLYGCSRIFPSASPTIPLTPTISPTATETPIRAKAFMQSVGTDADKYPLRYYSPEGAISLAVPSHWVFNQQKDSEMEVDSISETYEGEVVAAIYKMAYPSEDKNVQQAVEGFLHSIGLTDRHVEISNQAEFGMDSGTSGWRADGTIERVSGNGREECILIASLNRNLLYALVAYPERATTPDVFRTEFEKMARSLQWEETATLNFDKTNALQLLSEEPETLDPARTHAGTDGAIGDLYSGLVTMDRSLRIQPALAEWWDVTPDGKTYTFHLRKNAHFQNGRPVEAGDVLFSWLRAASPDLDSETGPLALGDIIGLKEYHEGKSDQISGIRLVDSYTLQLTLSAPVPAFLEKLTLPGSWIVDRYDVRLPHWELHPNGTGPFRMVQRVPRRSILLEPNSQYYDSIPKVEYLTYWISSAPQETLYKSKKIDQMRLTGDPPAEVKNPHDPLFGNVVIEQRLCTNFVTLDNSIPPFDDPLIRKAFALSIDRSIYVEVTTAQGDLPGYGILPPGMPGYSPEWTPEMFDPQTAKQLLRQSHYFNGSDLSTGIQLWLPVNGLTYDSAMEFLVDSWKKNLDIGITVEGLPPDEYQNRRKAKTIGPIWMDSLCADYADPESMYDFLFASGSPRNLSNYYNNPMDILLDAAKSELDWSTRLGFYRKADQIIFDEAPIIILSYSGPNYIVWKPYVTGYAPTFVGVPQHQLLSIIR
jgi:oligopeptide transport system substrate-binding protein